MDTQIKTQNRLASVKQLSCPNCGASHYVQHPRAKYLACDYCGSLLDLSTEQAQVLKLLNEPKKHRPLSFVALGQIAQFQGKSYQVIARTRWRMKYKEYWVEDGESGYSNEVWIFDEWLLISEERTYFYLIEDKEGYGFSKEIIPEVPMLMPRDKRMNFYTQQRAQIVREYGQAEAIYFEGESNYEIKLGDVVRFAMYKVGRTSYSAEWRLDEEGEIKEIEFFQEQPIPRKEMLEAFAQNEEVEELKKKFEYWSFVQKNAWRLFWVMLVLFVYSLFSNGSEIHKETFDLNQGIISPDKSQYSQPLAFPKKGLYRLRLKAYDMPENTEMMIFAYILGEDSLAINKLEGNFYYWAGYDDEGRWEESDKSQKKTFKLGQAGTYRVQIFGEMEYANMGKLELTVYKGVLLSRYFFLGIFISIIIILFAQSRKK